jgi:hypothetical protein
LAKEKAASSPHSRRQRGPQQPATLRFGMVVDGSPLPLAWSGSYALAVVDGLCQQHRRATVRGPSLSLRSSPAWLPPRFGAKNSPRGIPAPRRLVKTRHTTNRHPSTWPRATGRRRRDASPVGRQTQGCFCKRTTIPTGAIDMLYMPLQPIDGGSSAEPRTAHTVRYTDCSYNPQTEKLSVSCLMLCMNLKINCKCICLYHCVAIWVHMYAKFTFTRSLAGSRPWRRTVHIHMHWSSNWDAQHHSHSD